MHKKWLNNFTKTFLTKRGNDMGEYKVDGWNNFCRVFEAPDNYSGSYCSGGGIATNFQMVDWFNPVENICNPAVSKEVWIEEVGPIETVTVDHDEFFRDVKCKVCDEV